VGQFATPLRGNPERGGRQQPHQTLKKSKKYKGGKKHHTMVATPLRAPPLAAKDILAVPSTHVLDCDPWLQFYIIESRVPKLLEHIFLFS
jgi:hypothetical protein